MLQLPKKNEDLKYKLKMKPLSFPYMVHGNETIHVNQPRSHTWYMRMRLYMLTTLIPIYGKLYVYHPIYGKWE